MSFANVFMPGIESAHSTPASSKTALHIAESDCSPVISSPTDIMSVSSTESFGSTDGGQAQSPNSNGSVLHTAADPPPQYKKHERFYFDDGNVTFIVQDVAFRVHRYFFQRDSKYFADMLKQQLGEEAVREDKPIHLNDVASDEFEALLKLMYPLKLFTQELASLSAWTAVLRLSTLWSFASLRALAIATLPVLALPVDKIVLGRTYDVPAWLCPGFVALCQRGTPLTQAEARRLGVADVVMVAGLRESIRAQKAPWSERSMVSAVEMCLKSPEVLDRGHLLPLEPMITPAQSEGMDVDANAKGGQAVGSGGQKAVGSGVGNAAGKTQAMSSGVQPVNMSVPLGSYAFAAPDKKNSFFGFASPVAALSPVASAPAPVSSSVFGVPNTRPATKHAGQAA